MFKEGAKYEFHMLEGGDDVTSWGTIEKYEHPLIKLEDTQVRVAVLGGGEGELKTYPGKIINVTSPNFVSAEEQV